MEVNYVAGGVGPGVDAAADQLCDLGRKPGVPPSQCPHLPVETEGLADLEGPLRPSVPCSLFSWLLLL